MSLAKIWETTNQLSLALGIYIVLFCMLSRKSHVDHQISHRRILSLSDFSPTKKTLQQDIRGYTRSNDTKKFLQWDNLCLPAADKKLLQWDVWCFPISGWNESHMTKKFLQLDNLCFAISRQKVSIVRSFVFSPSTAGNCWATDCDWLWCWVYFSLMGWSECRRTSHGLGHIQWVNSSILEQCLTDTLNGSWRWKWQVWTQDGHVIMAQLYPITAKSFKPLFAGLVGVVYIRKWSEKYIANI